MKLKAVLIYFKTAFFSYGEFILELGEFFMQVYLFMMKKQERRVGTKNLKLGINK